MNFFVQLQSSLLIFFSGLVVDQHGTWLVLPCRKLNWRACTDSSAQHKGR